MATFPLLTFIFYQWTLKDSWLSTFLSVLTLLAIIALVGYPAFHILRVARRESPSSLYALNELHLSRNGPLYAQYRPPRYFFFLTLLTAYFIRAILIGFAQASGDAQLALMIVLEFSLVVAHLILKPFNTKGGNIFSTYLAVSRFVCTALMIAFIQSLNVAAIPRVVIGIIIAVILSVSIIVVVLNLVLHTVGGLLRRKSGNLTSSSGSTDGSQGLVSEKGNGESITTYLETPTSPDEVSSDDSLDHHLNGSLTDEAGRERPVNPTPYQSPIRDSYPYIISPTATVTTSMDPPSLYSRDSRTITVGSLLPRRWSFSLSQPSSPVGSSMGHTSLAPSPIPTPSPSENGAFSTNASLGHHIPRYQHDDIQEESFTSSSTITQV